MSDDFIDYGKLIDDAMHVIVRKALQRVSKEGLPGKHHFFISFLTNYPGVVISDNLKQKYPDEMTIVLQHQFEDLKVTDKRFDVVLSFDNVKENIGAPFDALLAFADPSVKFGLQFRQMDEIYEDDMTELEEMTEAIEKELMEDLEAEKQDSKSKKKSSKSKKESANVVDIDAFRKK
ncbi:MAG: ClpXP protease specificity-enhancing factor SspB [Rickettsiales bacterium]|nr:ClpXP protease specificity-enhancing factor SspB [Pseudomonadota bacterium]MDG4544160.1 ClpXP protease specificity-enhancing factor SspB [Rickettsiales bacterium]PIR38461.1 MAG: hypothetical protein COV35_06750 [Alphaproteobacteria bacterium CG11_big_fil_rev_8_21_14_0_20_39_49]MDA0967180.1 ClpXP protease specificity-enhancing factor SspB [Pseudomonadota bacterium]MDG4546341.1 ClpXP protease specificity-enhancing factor SspB [Rickettsiales bacterium]